ncbi:helix-turn-helix domain-containing protein [Halomicroarcula sp. GCM10025709]|uniref:helix-turn-helix domain-containing protein n=1 Tax=Haloarcula TaxID=2237 RepID=UPI0024C36FE3|nr:helix-turn-helix domain-containing protein [Halomicroarcula sp. YJ-61-S]
MSLFVNVGLSVPAIPPGGVVPIQTDVTLELERVVPTASATHFLWLVGENHQQFFEGLRGESTVESITVLDEFDDRLFVRLHWTALENPFLDLLDESDVVLVEARGTADGWEATLRFPDEAALRTFYEASEQRGLGVELRAINGSRIDESGDMDALSPVQRETLEAAFRAGYFDVPRSITIAELAAQLDRSEQAVSEALRRAMANYLQTTLQQGDTSEADADDEGEASDATYCTDTDTNGDG